MSEELNLGFTNTATDPATPARTLSPSPINFGADWRVLSDEPGEVVLTHINVPTSRPVKARFAVSEVADIYKGSLIEAPAMFSPGSSRRGLALLNQLVLTGMDGNGQLSPYTVGITARIPTTAEMSPDDLVVAIQQLLGLLFETGASDTASRLSSLLHQALKPVDL